MRTSVNPLTWVMDNPIIWVVVLGAASWISKFLRGRGRSGQPLGAPLAADEAERTRRVQEDVRRRIAERRSGAAPAVPPIRSQRPPAPEALAPRPIARSTGGTLREMLQSMRDDLTPLPEPPADETQTILARQRQLEEDMRTLEAATRAADSSRRARNVALEPKPIPAYDWLGELRDPNSMRRAIILREILGPPIGLR